TPTDCWRLARHRRRRGTSNIEHRTSNFEFSERPDRNPATPCGSGGPNFPKFKVRRSTFNVRRSPHFLTRPMNPSRLRMLMAALALIATACIGSSSAFGQAAPAQNPTSTSSGTEPQKLESFVVIGSYIPSTETAVEAGPSPVIRIDRQEIEQSGYTTT